MAGNVRIHTIPGLRPIGGHHYIGLEYSGILETRNPDEDDFRLFRVAGLQLDVHKRIGHGCSLSPLRVAGAA